MTWHNTSSASRGYGRRWQKQRAIILAQEPLCRPCTQKTLPRTTLATIVDHILSKALGGTDEVTNLQPICHPCHDRKTRHLVNLRWPNPVQDFDGQHDSRSAVISRWPSDNRSIQFALAYCNPSPGSGSV